MGVDMDEKNARGPDFGLGPTLQTDSSQRQGFAPHSTVPLAPVPRSLYNRGSIALPAAPPDSPMLPRRVLLRLVATVLLAWGAGHAASVAAAVATPPTVLVVGDSISAAYGLPVGTGWVDLLAARIKTEGLPHRVVNASISGDTTAGGRSRLTALLTQHKPSIVVIELGGNDGLRGGNLQATRDNLEAMVTLAQKAAARVLLVGTRLPPNYGAAYTREFDALFADVAKRRNVPLVPYFFAGFGENSEMFQPDRIHPTVAAQPRLLDNVWPALKPLLGKSR
jgi:acyl-CoA thioesterase I